jgi:hypothetical protein
LNASPPAPMSAISEPKLTFWFFVWPLIVDEVTA